MLFEWDPEKAETNAAKHGVTFEQAIEVFNSDYLELDDEGPHGEARFRVLGLTNRGAVLLVITTDRNDAVRIISARSATRSEIEQYFKYLQH